jgi:hypothetical protein
MKLAEALILRADYQKRIEQLRQRIVRNAKVQEGDTPAEDPVALLAELRTVSVSLTRLVQQINTTNARTAFGPAGVVSDALAERDSLKQRQAILREIAQGAVPVQQRNTRSEVRFVSTVDVSAIQAEADGLAREHRELDSRIQEANWLTELIEDTSR